MIGLGFIEAPGQEGRRGDKEQACVASINGAHRPIASMRTGPMSFGRGETVDGIAAVREGRGLLMLGGLTQSGSGDFPMPTNRPYIAVPNRLLGEELLWLEKRL